MSKNFKKKAIQIVSFNRFVFKFPPSKRVFLTFDDGPHPVYTLEILKILKNFQAPSTFFLLGENVKRYASIATKIQEEGHTIGMHTFNHKTLDQMTRTEFDSDIKICQSLIMPITDHSPRILRPPQGKLNLIHLYWAVLNRVKIVHYTITSNDWNAKDVSDIQDSIPIEKIVGGEIINFHDNNLLTVTALPGLLESVRSRGYSFASIPDVF